MTATRNRTRQLASRCTKRWRIPSQSVVETDLATCRSGPWYASSSSTVGLIEDPVTSRLRDIVLQLLLPCSSTRSFSWQPSQVFLKLRQRKVRLIKQCKNCSQNFKKTCTMLSQCKCNVPQYANAYWNVALNIYTVYRKNQLLLFSCIILRKSNQFEWKFQTK